MSKEEMTGRELTPIYVEADIRVDIRHKTFHVYLSEEEAGEISAAIDREVRKALAKAVGRMDGRRYGGAERVTFNLSIIP